MQYLPGKKRVILFFIFLLAAALRFWQLGVIPSGLTNDEASYIYNAYSIWHTHRDITGHLFPLSINLDNSLSPIPMYLVAPVVGLFGLSPFTGRLLFALAGLGTVMLVYLLAKRLFNNEFIAQASMFVLAVSPWHVHFSRTAYEGILALFFYILGIYIFIYFLEKGKIYLSLPFFFLGFFSYHATKVFFVFLLPILFFIYKKEILRYKRSLSFFLLGILFIFGLFFWISRTQHVTRGEVFLQYNSPAAVKLILEERNNNSAPFFLRQIFNNKITYLLRVYRENYLEAFSPQFLFLYGETSGLYGIYGPSFRGELYIIEIPLLLFGLFYLCMQKNNKSKYFVFLGLLIAPLPSTFTVDKSYALRSIMMVPFFAISIGCGIYYLHTLYKSRLFFKPGAITFCVLYIFFISSYLYQYYFRYSIYGSESWFRSSRDVVEIADRQKNNYQHIFIVNSGDLLIQYAMFAHADPTLVQKAYISHSPKKVGSNTFLVDGCMDTHGNKLFNPKAYLPKSTLYIVPALCYPDMQPDLLITQVGEPQRVIWKIYEKQ